MAVKLRLKRMGAKKQPFYRIVAADSRAKRDGRFIEVVGTYNPLTDPAEIKIDEDASMEIGSRSRGTPRIANRLLKRVRDFALVEEKDTIDYEIAKKALDRLEIDEIGLDNSDREMLTTVITKFNGGPVGLDTLAASIGEDRDTIEDVYEPYLMQIGFLTRSPRGRLVTKLAYEHLGYEFNDN